MQAATVQALVGAWQQVLAGRSETGRREHPVGAIAPLGPIGPTGTYGACRSCIGERLRCLEANQHLRHCYALPGMLVALHQLVSLGRSYGLPAPGAETRGGDAVTRLTCCCDS